MRNFGVGKPGFSVENGSSLTTIPSPDAILDSTGSAVTFDATSGSPNVTITSPVDGLKNIDVEVYDYIEISGAYYQIGSIGITRKDIVLTTNSAATVSGASLNRAKYAKYRSVRLKSAGVTATVEGVTIPQDEWLEWKANDGLDVLQINPGGTNMHIQTMD